MTANRLLSSTSRYASAGRAGKSTLVFANWVLAAVPYMEKLSELSGLPVWMTSAEETVAEKLHGQVPGLLPMKLQEKYFDLPEQKGTPKAEGILRRTGQGPVRIGHKCHAEIIFRQDKRGIPSQSVRPEVIPDKRGRPRRGRSLGESDLLIIYHCNE